ncbi:MAG TPA: hypothetical protein VKV06_13600 [Acidimicrobiales bacterium]|nr:hypothetical protein [Acidimicrobiales bacterium]
MLTVHLGGELARRLASEAARRGITIDQFVTESLTAALHEPHHDSSPGQRLGFVAIDASGQTRGAADADELLAEGFGHD